MSKYIEEVKGSEKEMNKLTLELPHNYVGAAGIKVYLNDVELKGVTSVNLEELDIDTNKTIVTLKLSVDQFEFRGFEK